MRAHVANYQHKIPRNVQTKTNYLGHYFVNMVDNNYAFEGQSCVKIHRRMQHDRIFHYFPCRNEQKFSEISALVV